MYHASVAGDRKAVDNQTCRTWAGRSFAKIDRTAGMPGRQICTTRCAPMWTTIAFWRARSQHAIFKDNQACVNSARFC